MNENNELELPNGVFSRPKYRPRPGAKYRASSRSTCRPLRKLHFTVRLRVAGKLQFIGNFETVEIAARAHDEALYLLSNAELVPWYLRFNDACSFTVGSQLMTRDLVSITNDKVLTWFDKQFGSAQQRNATRAYYASKNIPLNREQTTPNPQLAPRSEPELVRSREYRGKRGKGSRGPRGPYGPRVAKATTWSYEI